MTAGASASSNPRPRPAGAGAVVPVFATAIFLNAALLFAVEPMFTKMVLPLLGGTPSVWNTCLLFYQGALLAGYGYAHLTSRWLTVPRQAALHLACLAGAMFLLPVALPPGAAPPPGGSAEAIGWLLARLTTVLGVPFLLLAAGAPLLQRWFSTTRHPSASNPYFLYVASNLGSFAALLAYPVLIEPRLRLGEQSVRWAQGYGVLVLLVLAAAVQGWRWRRHGAEEGERLPLEEEARSPLEVAGEGGGADGGVVMQREDTGGNEMVRGESGGEGNVVVGGAPRPRIVFPTNNPSASASAHSSPHPSSTHHSPVGTTTSNPTPSPTLTPTRAWRLRWVLLSFAPSSLLLGVTTFLSTDIAAVPFLWVIPLALYLLTFVLTFAQRPLLNRRLMLALQVGLVLALLLTIGSNPADHLHALAALHLVAFFVCTMVCHRELADARPRAEHLTEYYLWISLGGLLGGVFNVLLAPALYDTVVEYPFALILVLGLRPAWRTAAPATRAAILDVAIPLAILALMVTGYHLPTAPGRWGDVVLYGWLGLLGVVAASCFQRPLRLAMAGAALFLGNEIGLGEGDDTLYQGRSFYGVYRVRRWDNYVLLQHGTTTHGGQSLVASRKTEPLTYYHRQGPLGDLFRLTTDSVSPRRVALVGLGTGTTACYARAGEQWSYFEIDPLIVAIARDPRLFTYLRDCQPGVRIVMGDARLSLAREPDGSYDLITLDAFSSDAIPVHLVTREALAMYRRKLRPGGIVAFHISNRYLDLRPVLVELARDARMAGAIVDRDVDDEEKDDLHYGSRWVALADGAHYLAPLVREAGWDVLAPSASVRVWTDDYSDVLGVLKAQ